MSPHFRHVRLDYAVQKGVHCFAEKPIAVDGPGPRKFLQVCEDAKVKNLRWAWSARRAIRPL